MTFRGLKMGSMRSKQLKYNLSADNGCPWDEYTCSYAVLNGYLGILKWARRVASSLNII
jgi:hypothetical protein